MSKSMNRERFRDNLRRIHIESGLTQNEVSKRMGVGERMVQCWLKGRYVPAAEYVYLLSEVYDCDMAEFFRGCF